MKLLSYTEIDQGIGEIRLRSPKNLNALTEELSRQFAETTLSLSGPNSPRILLLSGEGKSFSSGGHLEMLQAKTEKSYVANKRDMLHFYRSFLSIRNLNVPLIAVLNGSVVGAGLALACACDVRLCESSARFAAPFGRLGLHPGMGISYTLPKVVGESRARELLLTNRTIGAEEALQIGLVTEVVEGDNLQQRALELARAIWESGEFAQKQLMETFRADEAELQSALEREAHCQAENYGSDEFRKRLSVVMKRIAT